MIDLIAGINTRDGVVTGNAAQVGQIAQLIQLFHNMLEVF